MGKYVDKNGLSWHVPLLPVGVWYDKSKRCFCTCAKSMFKAHEDTGCIGWLCKNCVGSVSCPAHQEYMEHIKAKDSKMAEVNEVGEPYPLDKLGPVDGVVMVMVRDEVSKNEAGPLRLLAIEDLGKLSFCVWDCNEAIFYDIARHCTPEELAPPAPPVPKMRPMTRCECMQWAAWANEQARLGLEFWVVTCNQTEPPENDAGKSPTHYMYIPCNGLQYWRSKLDPATDMPVKWEKMEVEE